MLNRRAGWEPGLLHPHERLHDLYEVDRVDNADAPPCRDPFDGLGILQVGVHPRFRIGKPSPDMPEGLPGIFLITRHNIGRDQVADQRTEANHGVTVLHEVIGVGLPVTADIGTVGACRVGPPVIAFGIEIMDSPGTPFGPVGRNGQRLFRQRLFAPGHYLVSEQARHFFLQWKFPLALAKQQEGE